ncbi:hypothetical protein [Belnapia rosea]|uniref:Uncharacterized protein n=1 Tax=Belnapia rosea TaxID=938405 RepID=A0A1G7ASL6_9PROT|nr:hypothetical protein [Belnapia rosea]SDB73993.1 hypothetical protein SAMN02927895_04975 [Belnapia rosea]SDE17781.1 hypothetical protein SAMN04487779_102125 [Belnapia rosea]
MSFAWFDDAADWAGQAWEAVADAAKAVCDAATYAAGLLILMWLVVHLGPIFLVWLAGAPAWAVLMLIFGL